MALNRPSSVVKDRSEKDVKSEKKLDVYVLQDILFRNGQDALVRDLAKCLIFYEGVKEKEKWSSDEQVTVKYLGKGFYTCGKWRVQSGETIVIPKFEADRVMKDFPGKFEIMKEED